MKDMTSGERLIAEDDARRRWTDRRGDTIAAFDVVIHLVRRYIDECNDSSERVRLVGLLPNLERDRAHFENATAPEEE